MENADNRRKNYYIKKDFQRNFILKFCALVLIGSAVSGAIIYVMSLSTVTTAFENSKLVIRSTADFILPAVLLSSLVFIILVGIASIAITLFTSHKIAGPLYRMEKDICEVAAGNLRQEFNLRVGDELRPMAEALNGMSVFLKDRVSIMKVLIADLESYERGAGLGLPPDIKKKIEALKAEADKLKT